MHVLNQKIQFSRLLLTRIVSTKAALDGMTMADPDPIVLRVAPDEAYVYPPTDVQLDDEWAIVETDSAFAGEWVPADVMAEIILHHCEWEPPFKRPAFAQGMLAGLPVKLWFEEDRVLILVPGSLAAEMEERIRK